MTETTRAHRALAASLFEAAGPQAPQHGHGTTPVTEWVNSGFVGANLDPRLPAMAEKIAVWSTAPLAAVQPVVDVERGYVAHVVTNIEKACGLNEAAPSLTIDERVAAVVAEVRTLRDRARLTFVDDKDQVLDRVVAKKTTMGVEVTLSLVDGCYFASVKLAKGGRLVLIDGDEVKGVVRDAVKAAQKETAALQLSDLGRLGWTRIFTGEENPVEVLRREDHIRIVKELEAKHGKSIDDVLTKWTRNAGELIDARDELRIRLEARVDELLTTNSGYHNRHVTDVNKVKAAAKINAVIVKALMDGEKPWPTITGMDGLPVCYLDTVEKPEGYVFRGTVVAAYLDTKGEDHVVVENADGLQHIFRGKQVRGLRQQPTTTTKAEVQAVKHEVIAGVCNYCGSDPDRVVVGEKCLPRCGYMVASPGKEDKRCDTFEGHSFGCRHPDDR